MATDTIRSLLTRDGAQKQNQPRAFQQNGTTPRKARNVWYTFYDKSAACLSVNIKYAKLFLLLKACVIAFAGRAQV